jgi:integrase
MFRYLSTVEFGTVLERATAFEGQTTCAGRMAAGITLGLHGLRCTEVCGLRVNDLDASRGALHVDTLKHGVPRDVDLKPRIAAWLAKLAHGNAASAPLFRTCRGRTSYPNQFQRAWQRSFIVCGTRRLSACGWRRRICGSCGASSATRA